MKQRGDDVFLFFGLTFIGIFIYWCRSVVRIFGSVGMVVAAELDHWFNTFSGFSFLVLDEAQVTFSLEMIYPT